LPSAIAQTAAIISTAPLAAPVLLSILLVGQRLVRLAASPRTV